MSRVGRETDLIVDYQYDESRSWSRDQSNKDEIYTRNVIRMVPPVV